MNEGDSVLFADEAGKLRPAVVLRLVHERAVIVPGTRTRRDGWPNVTVERDSQDARDLGLYDTTYFYRRSVTVVTQTRLGARAGRCRLQLFMRLCAMAGITG